MEYLFVIPNSQQYLLKDFAVELKSIVRDKGMRYREASDNVLPEKLLYVHILDICQRLSFNPFGEIVCADQ